LEERVAQEAVVWMRSVRLYAGGGGDTCQVLVAPGGGDGVVVCGCGV
jgi:hypothetical protein